MVASPMTPPRELADLCERSPGFDAETLREIADTLLAQADEIFALKAAAIVQGSIKLAEWAKVATRREAIKDAWNWINGNGGWLSCVAEHDCRCACAHLSKPNPLVHCTCGADAFRKLMEE